MPQNRNVKVKQTAKLIQGYINNYFLSKAKTLDRSSLSITEVILTNDMSIATIYYSTFDKEANLLELEQKIKTEHNQIRAFLAQKLKMRKCPKLIFKFDDLINYGNRIEQLIASTHNDDHKNNF